MAICPLNEAQIAHFAREGYLIVPGFFAAEEVTAIRSEMERLERAGLGRNTMPEVTGRVNYQIRRLDEQSALFRALFFHKPVLQVVGQLIGEPLLLWLDQIYLKPARVGVGNVWHIDNTCFRAPDMVRGVGMWTALHDASRANGTLEVIPRSFTLPEVAESRGVILDYPLLLRLADDAAAVPAQMAAGGVVFFNFGMLHCTRDNLSDGPRAGLALHYLQSDNLPDASAMAEGRNIPLSGPAADWGASRYGQSMEDAWEREVRRVLATPGSR